MTFSIDHFPSSARNLAKPKTASDKQKIKNIDKKHLLNYIIKTIAVSLYRLRGKIQPMETQ